jgi:hypothetical protein
MRLHDVQPDNNASTAIGSRRCTVGSRLTPGSNEAGWCETAKSEKTPDAFGGIAAMHEQHRYVDFVWTRKAEPYWDH